MDIEIRLGLACIIYELDFLPTNQFAVARLWVETTAYLYKPPLQGFMSVCKLQKYLVFSGAEESQRSLCCSSNVWSYQVSTPYCL